MAGRPRKSEAELREAGTWRKDRHGQKTIIGKRITSIPKMPDSLPDRAKKDWKRVCQLLIDTEVLTAHDIDALELYVLNLITYRDAMDDVRVNGFTVTIVNGNGIPSTIKNPAWDIARQAGTEIRLIADRFGFNPNSRQKIKSDPASEKQSPFELLMKKTV